jgi:hypothetical protein
MASERKKSSSKDRSVSGKQLSARSATPKALRPASGRKQRVLHYVVCVRNDNYPASLELRKLYPVFEDSFAAQHGMVRVVDESGEDYLYPTEFFVHVELPASIEKALAQIA